MTKEVHDNVQDGAKSKITVLADKFAALTFSIAERFKELKKINDDLRAANFPG
jgi:hypothetical protein